MHELWLYLNFSTFWIIIFKAFSEISKIQFHPDPVWALLGLTSKDQTSLIKIFSHWVKDVMHLLKENIAAVKLNK